MSKYTLVKHSGLDNAVELASVKGKAKIASIIKAGGLILDTYKEADTAEFVYNYDGVEGIYPDASINGSFGRIKVDGLPLYIPN